MTQQRALAPERGGDGWGACFFFVSSVRPCRWHLGSLNSAQDPVLMQPISSSALLNPWASTTSSEGAQKVPWASTRKGNTFSTKLSFSGLQSLRLLCSVKATLSRAVATFLITANRERTWPEITSAAGLCSKGFQSISVACVRAQEPPGYCEIGLLGGVRVGGHFLPFLRHWGARSTGITGQWESTFERKQLQLPSLDTGMPVCGLELIRSDLLLAARNLVPEGLMSDADMTTELYLWMV